MEKTFKTLRQNIKRIIQSNADDLQKTDQILSEIFIGLSYRERASIGKEIMEIVSKL